MVKEDIFNRILSEGDYVAYPNQGSLEVAKVIKMMGTKSWSNRVKLSCELIINKNWASKQKDTQIEDLSRHNSYFYRELYGTNFIILDLPDDPVNENNLKSRKQLQNEQKLQISGTT
jgi:hypothetical protein